MSNFIYSQRFDIFFFTFQRANKFFDCVESKKGSRFFKNETFQAFEIVFFGILIHDLKEVLKICMIDKSVMKT